MSKVTYMGEPAPRWLPLCVFEGWRDRAGHGLTVREQLYIRPFWKCAGWRIGHSAAVLCGYPSRLKKTSSA